MKTTLTDRAVKSAKADSAASYHGSDEQMFGAK